MTISVDTEKIKLMSSLIQNANSEIDECVANLSFVTEHNDWNCKERDLINEGILEVKKDAAILQESIDYFAAIMKRIADMFDEFESAIPNKYQKIDAYLGTTLSIPCEESSVGAFTVSMELKDQISSGVHMSGGLENNAIGNLTNPIHVCNFDDVNFGKLE